MIKSLENVNILTEAFGIKIKCILTKFVMVQTALITTLKAGIQILTKLAIDVN